MQIKGSFIQVIIVTVLMAGWMIARLFFAYVDLDTQGTHLLKNWISAEYSRYQLNRQDISVEEKARLLESAQAIEFVSMAARGTPKRLIVQVIIAPNPAQPPNQSRERYYRMEHSLLLGWRNPPVISSKLSYILAVFGA